MGYVFVSYSRRQSAAADTLIDWMERNGIAVWKDTASMPAGVAWRRQVTEAIRGADLVVMCVSRLWYGSRACRDEEHWAAHYHRPQVRIPVDEGRFDPARAVAAIQAAWAAVTPEDRLAGELETAAGDWANRGGRSRDLARGRALKAYRRAFGGSARGPRGSRQGTRGGGAATAAPRPITSVAARYLTQSIRRGVILRVLAALAAIAIVCAGVSGVTFATRMRQIDAANTQANEESRRWDALRDALDESPYKAMETVLAQPHDAATMRGSMFVATMRMVLAAHVPDDYGDATDPRFSGYDFPDALDTRRPDALADAGVSAATIAKTRGYAVSPDGLEVAALGGADVRILDARRGDTLMTLTGANLTKVTSMAWSEDGSALAVRSSDGKATVWKVRAGTTIVKNTGSWFMDGAALGGVGGASGNGSRAALLARDGRVTLVDTAKGRVVSDAVRVPVDVGVAIATAPDATDTAVVAGTKDGNTVLYRVAFGGDASGADGAGGAGDAGDAGDAGKATRIEVPDGCAPGAIAVLPGGREIAIGCGAQIDVIGMRGGGPSRTIVNDAGADVTALRADGEGRLFVGFDGGTLAVVEAGSSTLIRPDAAASDVGSVGICLGGTARAVAVSGSKALFVGDGTPAQLCSRGVSRSRTGDGGANGVDAARRDKDPWTMHIGMTDFASLTDAHQSRAVAAAPDGSAFAAGLSDGSVMFARYDMQPGPLVREIPGEVRVVVYAPDGKRVVAATRDGVIYTVVAPDAGEYEGATLRRQVQERLDRARKLGLAR
ncbi:toll/interleukin-1 receptor domain-containing protein [Bifidobacterium parmae]|uniref:Calmodulin-like 3-like protein n=1 Tax=Bifidobacterium parmae TaxID=361854 RepID=A0A2N5IVT9_9BIFI|nr:toll/interleukin-1 receptor domain-containing protein [Bifidobacterium parmae]PLS26082.1 calmodulin-like 3-like protein [Bifidobacterium parmae]